jgi:hypothetical protein
MNVSTVSLSCRFTVCPKETDAAKIVVMKIRMCRIMLAYNGLGLGEVAVVRVTSAQIYY